MTPAAATPASRPASISQVEVLEASVPADWIRAGQQSTVRVTVRNPGPTREFEVEVVHGGASVTTVTVSLPDDGTTTYEFGVVSEDPRCGGVMVGGVRPVEVTAAPADVASPTRWLDTDADGGAGPIAGLVVAVLSVLLWLFYIRLSEYVEI